MLNKVDVYRRFSRNYDELIEAEDYNDNLGSYIQKKIDWNDKVIYEAGIGTGRIPKKFINQVKRWYAFDRELHMLSKCKRNIKNKKLSLSIADNINLPIIDNQVDIFIEGWSFCHTITENAAHYPDIAHALINRLHKIVNNNGKIVIIEPEGTNVPNPIQSNSTLRAFYGLLEKYYNFKKMTVRTDYKFSDYCEAARILGFFFGAEMKEIVLKQEKKVIEEYTGVWINEVSNNGT